MENEQSPLQIEAVVLDVMQVESGRGFIPDAAIAAPAPRGLARFAPTANRVARFLNSEPVKKTTKGAALVALGVALELAGQQIAKSLGKSGTPIHTHIVPPNSTPTPLSPEISPYRVIYREVHIYQRIERWTIPPRKEQK